jgi:hypothetical protein
VVHDAAIVGTGTEEREFELVLEFVLGLAELEKSKKR